MHGITSVSCHKTAWMKLVGHAKVTHLRHTGISLRHFTSLKHNIHSEQKKKLEELYTPTLNHALHLHRWLRQHN
jgi:hypothetical protein